MAKRKPGNSFNCYHKAKFILLVSVKHEANKHQPFRSETTQTVCFYWKW